MRKFILSALLFVGFLAPSWAQMELYLPKEFSGVFDTDMFKFPVQEENYKVYMTIAYAAGTVSTDIRSLYTHSKITFTGRLIHSSVNRDMVMWAINDALKEAGIPDIETFAKYSKEVREKLHHLYFKNSDVVWEWAGITASVLSLGSAAYVGAAATAMSATGSVISAASGIHDWNSSSTLGKTSIAISNGTDATGRVLGLAGSVNDAARLSAMSSAVGNAGSAVGTTLGFAGMVDSKQKELLDRIQNREYALALVRLHAFYKYFNYFLQQYAAQAEATNWIIVLDQNQKPTFAGIDGIQCPVNVTTATTFFKVSNPSDYKNRRSFEGLYSGFLKYNLTFDMSKYDKDFISDIDPFYHSEQGEELPVFMTNPKTYTSQLDQFNLAEDHRGKINEYKWMYPEPIYVNNVKYDTDQATKMSVEYNVPVTCNVSIKYSSKEKADVLVESLKQGDFMPGYESWGPVDHAFVTPHVSIYKSASGSIAMKAGDRIVNRVYVGTKVWTENGILYKDMYAETERLAARFKTAAQLDNGIPVENAIEGRTPTLTMKIDMKSTIEPTYLSKDVIDQQVVEERHEILQSTYWNLKGK